MIETGQILVVPSSQECQEKARAELREYLEQVRELRKIWSLPDGFVYYGAEDFLLQHGTWCEIAAPPIGTRAGTPKQCFANSARLAKRRKWKYVEGYASAQVGKGGAFPTAHAWNIDDNGRLVDVTWFNSGLAYVGVQFSVDRALDALKNEGSVLEDWNRHYPIFRERWTGERFGNRKVTRGLAHARN